MEKLSLLTVIYAPEDESIDLFEFSEDIDIITKIVWCLKNVS